MKVETFNFDLPDELIAQNPSDKRDHSALLCLNRSDESLSHRHFYDLASLLGPNDVLVLNNSRVFNARLKGNKATGAAIEVLLLSEEQPDIWRCLCKPAKRLHSGDVIHFSDHCSAKVLHKDNFVTLNFSYEGDFYELLDKLGEPPLPPYIHVDKPKEYSERYQTVYASEQGSVAAPTAGLHFTDELLTQLKQQGVAIEYVTLHVGYGTFKPVSVDNIKEHKMHHEAYSITAETAARLNGYKKEGKRIISVGTTTIRVLETACTDSVLQAGSSSSNIFIYPGYTFKFVDAMITNFHLPQSTLLMLVAAFAGLDFTLMAYQEAVKHKYRFYSFGDAMFIS